MRTPGSTRLVLMLLLAAGCGGPKFKPEEVPGAIADARAALDEGKTNRALKLMRGAQKTENLPTETRNEVQQVLEVAAERRIEELSAPGENPKKLADLIELELPRQIAVTAGLMSARRMYEDGDPMDAFNVIKKMDKRYPTHHERVATGQLLADIGFTLVEHPGRILWVTRMGRPIAVLEYLVVQYPAEERCDDAYMTLADIYEDKRLWALAIERHENLLLYHPLSPHVPYSEARIPHIRLRAVKSPEYDRKQLIRARTELESWDHEDPDLKHEVAVDLNDCLRRLTESDLGIARFYRRVDVPAGVEYHAERALETARLAKDPEREAKAQKLLDKLPVRVPAASNPAEAIP